jgi:hypothetical protein
MQQLSHIIIYQLQYANVQGKEIVASPSAGLITDLVLAM